MQAVAIALLATIAIGSALMIVAGRAPAHVWAEMVAAHVRRREYEVGQVAAQGDDALTLTGLAVALALEAGLFNIGAEGQLTAGVLACALVGAALPRGNALAIVADSRCARSRRSRPARRSARRSARCARRAVRTR